MKHYYKKIGLIAALVTVLGFITTSLKSQVLINEGFTAVVPLPAGWAQQNLSTPIGTSPTWFQGNTTVFPAFSGPTTSYAGANFNSVAGTGTISNWLFTPTVAIANGNIFTFYTRTTDGTFPDRLQLRMSTNGSSVNAGTTNTSVGDFTTLLIDVNPTLSNSGYPTVWTQFSAIISGVAVPTTGRFALRYFVTDGGSGANSDYIGVDEVLYGAPCSGAPTPGNTVSSVASVCPTIPFNLSLQNPPGGLGTTYQWQTSPDNVTWTNVPTGGTNSTLTTTLTAATYYRANVSCGASTTASTPIQVGLNAPGVCYCIPAASNCSLDDRIANVTFGTTLNNNSTCSANGYTNYTATVAATDIIAGGANPMRVTVGPGGTENVGVWIDYDKSGSFEASEFTLLGSGNGVTIAGNVVVPASAPLGQTRMRVRVRFSTAVTGTTACTTYTFGETEDYLVNLIPCVQGVITTQPTNKTFTCGGNTTFNVATTGSLITYKWQYRISATAPWLFVANAGVFSGATTNTLTITNGSSSINGYQFRVIIDGACTATEFSSVASLTVNPLVATVAKTPAGDICLGTIQKLSITNTTPESVVSVASAANLAIPIPDNGTTPGVNNTLALAGIPTGITVNAIRVRMNLTHSWVGDMVIALKAPNGKVLNLAYALTATGGAGPTTGFTNTIVASNGTAALSSGTNPYTATFRADAFTPATGDPSVPTGPNGYIPDVATFAGLFDPALTTSLNGNWTLAMYDYFDDGTSTNRFVNWSIEIAYSGGLANGVWTSPTPNSLYTDALATALYDGVTPVNTVYAKPTTAGATNYSVVVNNGLCTTPALTVPVNANAAITGTSTTSNKQVCIGGNTSFTATAPTGGSSISHQWKVSTDAGVTYTNVANGGVYSGATTATLNITGATAALNNYRYKDSLYVTACSSFVNTNASTLTVSPIPVVVLSANPTTQLYPGLTTTLSAAVNTTVAPANYTWFRNGVVIPGATGNTRVVDVDGLGVYTVSVNDVNACGSSSGSVTITSAANDILFIYPSPNSGQFQVRYYSEAANNPLPRIINIYDSKGARVFTQSYTVNVPYTQLNVNMTNAQTGIYSVELLDGNGRRIKTGRVSIL